MCASWVVFVSGAVLYRSNIALALVRSWSRQLDVGRVLAKGQSPCDYGISTISVILSECWRDSYGDSQEL